MQKTLVLMTRRPVLRDVVLRQSYEDPATIDPDVPLEKQERPTLPMYRSPADAQRDGWVITSGGPQKDGFIDPEGNSCGGWAWWMEKRDEAKAGAKGKGKA